MFSVFKGNFVILLLLLKLLPLIKIQRQDPWWYYLCLRQEQQFEFHSTHLHFAKCYQTELHNLWYKWNRCFSSAHLSLSCGLHYWQSDLRRCTKLSRCTYFLMIFDTNSTSLQMAFPPPHLPQLFRIVSKFQWDRLYFSPAYMWALFWKTNISIWEKINNTSDKQKARRFTSCSLTVTP